MTVIGFSGKLRSGKTTAAVFLQEYLESLGYKVGRISFAKELKDEVWRVLLKDWNVPREHLDDPDHKEMYRPLLVWYGTDFIRRMDYDHWTRIVQEKFASVEYQRYDFVINDDTRFWNEAELIERWGTLFRLTRNSNNYSNDHSSETDLDMYKFEHMLINAGTMEELKQTVITTVASIVLGKHNAR